MLKKFFLILLIILIAAGAGIYYFLLLKRPSAHPSEKITHKEIPQLKSVVSIPISLSLDRIEEALKKKISVIHQDFNENVEISPKRNDKRSEKGKEEKFLPIAATLDLNLKSLSINANDNLLTTTAIYFMKFNGRLDGKIKTVFAVCGDEKEKPELKFTLKSKFKLNKDGSILLYNKAWNIDWRNPCQITFLNLDVEQLLAKPALKIKFDALIDNFVANQIPNAIDLIPIINKTWESLQKPLKLGKGLFLKINPENAMIGSITGKGKILNSTITALCGPRLILADTAYQDSIIKLVLTDTLQKTDSIHFYLVSRTPLETLNEIIQKSLKKKEFNAGSFTIKIRKIEVYQSEEHIVFRVKLSKPFLGEVYLTGKPYYNLVSDEISFHDFKYTVETEEMLGKIAEYALTEEMLLDPIDAELKKITDKNLDKLFLKFDSFSKDLKNDITISGGLKHIQPVNIFVSDNQLFLLSDVVGVLDVKVN